MGKIICYLMNMLKGYEISGYHFNNCFNGIGLELMVAINSIRT